MYESDSASYHTAVAVDILVVEDIPAGNLARTIIHKRTFLLRSMYKKLLRYFNDTVNNKIITIEISSFAFSHFPLYKTN